MSGSFGDSFDPGIDELRRGVEAPDLSESILSEVDRRRGWLSARQRRFVALARWGTAAAAVGILAGVFAAQRFTPVEEIVGPAPERPLLDLMTTMQAETSVAVQSVSTRVRSLPVELVNQSREVVVAASLASERGERVFELDRPLVTVGETGIETMHSEAWMLGEPRGTDAMESVLIRIEALGDVQTVGSTTAKRSR